MIYEHIAVYGYYILSIVQVNFCGSVQERRLLAYDCVPSCEASQKKKNLKMG